MKLQCLQETYSNQRVLFEDLKKTTTDYAEDIEIVLARIRRERNRHARENRHLSHENAGLTEECDELRSERDDIEHDFANRGKEIRELQDVLHATRVQLRARTHGSARVRGGRGGSRHRGYYSRGGRGE